MDKKSGFLLSYVISTALMFMLFIFGYFISSLLFGILAFGCLFTHFCYIQRDATRKYEKERTNKSGMTNNRPIEQLEEIVKKQKKERTNKSGMTNNSTIEQLEEIVKKQKEDKAGIREPGQPSPEAHELYCRKMEAEFTPEERRIIRYKIGLENE